MVPLPVSVSKVLSEPGLAGSLMYPLWLSQTAAAGWAVAPGTGRLAGPREWAEKLTDAGPRTRFFKAHVVPRSRVLVSGQWIVSDV